MEATALCEVSGELRTEPQSRPDPILVGGLFNLSSDLFAKQLQFATAKICRQIRTFVVSFYEPFGTFIHSADPTFRSFAGRCSIVHTTAYHIMCVP